MIRVCEDEKKKKTFHRWCMPNVMSWKKEDKKTLNELKTQKTRRQYPQTYKYIFI